MSNYWVYASAILWNRQIQKNIKGVTGLKYESVYLESLNYTKLFSNIFCYKIWSYFFYKNLLYVYNVTEELQHVATISIIHCSI